MFFATIACCLTAVSATAIFAKDRYEAVDRVSNGIYTPGAFILAQLISAAIYNLIVAFIFICIFHWLTNLNPNGECFIYDIVVNWGVMMLMESFLLVVLELVKNDFLACTSGMVSVVQLCYYCVLSYYLTNGELLYRCTSICVLHTYVYNAY